MGRPLIDLTGQRFGKLLVARRLAYKPSRSPKWECICDCGNVHTCMSGNLRSGHTRSCGCSKAMTGEKNPSYRHGKTFSLEYRCFQQAKSRCTNPNVKAYHAYGGRGIKFLFRSWEEWTNELGPRPSLQHSVDRIDNNKHYELGNIRWATKKEQVSNRRKFGCLSKFDTASIEQELIRRTPEYGLCGC